MVTAEVRTSNPAPTHRNRPMSLRRATVLLTVLMTVSVLGAVPATAGTDASAEARLVQWANQARATNDLGALRTSSDLTAIARRHAVRMADEGRLSHNRSLTSEACCWTKIAENVGRGGDARAVHDGWMSSGPHRDNIMMAEATDMGVGVEVRDGVVWVVQIIRARTGEAPPPPPSSTAPSRSSTSSASSTSSSHTHHQSPAPAVGPENLAPTLPPRTTYLLARIEAQETGTPVSRTLGD